MNNANKKIALISDYFNLYLITLFIIFIKPKLFSGYHKSEHSQKPPVGSKWKLIEYGHGEINDVLKTYIGLKLIGKTWFVNTWKGKELKNDTWEIFGYKDIYRWDGIGEPEKPEIDKNTGEITDWKG